VAFILKLKEIFQETKDVKARLRGKGEEGKIIELET